MEGTRKTSYLDYFITQGISDYRLNIIHGGLIELTIKLNNENKLKTLEQTIEAYELAKKDYLKINYALTECLLSKGNLRLNINKLIGSIDKQYKPKKRKKEAYETLIKKYEREVLWCIYGVEIEILNLLDH